VRLTTEERSAQRTLLGLLRGGNTTIDTVVGLRIWRADGSGEYMASVEEISEHLDALRIPHHVAVVRRRYHGRVATGFEVQVAWDDLDTVLRWAPSLQKLIDALEQPRPTQTE
jgi:hypothetical protein